MPNNEKKYASLSTLQTFLSNLKTTFSSLGHKHTLSDITDYAVDSELSSSSTAPVQNKVLNAEFDEIAVSMRALETALDGKSDSSHDHNSLYYTETEIDTKLSAVNTSIDNIKSGEIVVKEAEHAGSADSATSANHATTAGSADSAIKATQDASGNVITTTYETKVDATAKLNEAKNYADSAASTAANTIKNDLLNGAGEQYDTLKELSDLINENTDALDALETVATNKADKTHASQHKTNGSDPITPADIGAFPKVGGTIDGNVIVEGNSTVKGNIILKKAENGYASVMKNHSDTNDYGTQVQDYSVDGDRIALQLRANNQTLNLVTTIDGTTENKQIIHEGNLGLITPSDIGAVGSLSDLGITVAANELNYMDGVTSNVQIQLDGKTETLVINTSYNNTLGATVVDRTFDEIVAAVNAGKVLTLMYGRIRYDLKAIYNNRAEFASVDGTTVTNIAVYNDGDVVITTTSLASSSHNHSASNITSGTLAIERGGTGATTAVAALTNLGITATASEINHLDGVTSNVQVQLDELQESVNSIPQSDWNQNDSSSKDYIKNRTHWVEEGVDVILAEQSIPNDYEFDELTDVTPPDSIVITIDNVEYQCEHWTNENGEDCYGDSRLVTRYDWDLDTEVTDTTHPENVPFYISAYADDGGGLSWDFTWYWWIRFEDNSSHIVKIGVPTGELVYHPLDDGFIPDTIARTSNTNWSLIYDSGEIPSIANAISGIDVSGYTKFQVAIRCYNDGDSSNTRTGSAIFKTTNGKTYQFPVWTEMFTNSISVVHALGQFNLADGWLICPSASKVVGDSVDVFDTEGGTAGNMSVTGSGVLKCSNALSTLTITSLDQSSRHYFGSGSRVMVWGCK